MEREVVTKRDVAGEVVGKEGVAGTRVQDSQAGDRGRKAWPGCLRVLLGMRLALPCD